LKDGIINHFYSMNFSNTIYQADSQRIGGRSISQSMAILLSVLFYLIVAPTQAQLFSGKTQALLPEEQAFVAISFEFKARILMSP